MSAVASIRPIVANEANEQAQPAQAVQEKPKVRVSAELFGSIGEESRGPTVTVTMDYDAEGRLRITFPKDLEFSMSRDTTSATRRLFVCKTDMASVPGAILVGHDAEGHPKYVSVDFKLSSTLNLSAVAVKA